jgi:hypothetical protein
MGDAVVGREDAVALVIEDFSETPAVTITCRTATLLYAEFTVEPIG